ncbi:olfactory receptor 51V1-like [Saccostrea echinata]|uniref:olfactory receptor 51V1-like n=1 Tax=Saccostrea echinata TaxID=191078 RepID=UPI002A7F2BD3|nr:olfactory receptor 51V1-like [Saccostrea echinata]
MESSTSMVLGTSDPLLNITPPVNVAFCSISEFSTCWLVSVCILLTSISLGGNIATFVHILYRRLHKEVTYMCILLVALSDSLSSALVYISMFMLYPNLFKFYFNIPLCVVFFWMTFTPFMWSSGNLVLLAYERYFLIINPLRYHSSHTSKRALKTSLVILFVMSLITISYAVALSFIKQCPNFLFVMYYFAFIGVPIVLIIIGMLVYLHCSKLMKLRTLPNISLRVIKRRQFSEMTFKVYLICITYAFGQMPFVINDIIVLLTEYKVLVSTERITNILYQIGTVALLTNYAVNPFVYFLSFDRLISFCKFKNKSLYIANSTENTNTTSF